jgi:hypothetical protein
MCLQPTDGMVRFRHGRRKAALEAEHPIIHLEGGDAGADRLDLPRRTRSPGPFLGLGSPVRTRTKNAGPLGSRSRCG